MGLQFSILAMIGIGLLEAILQCTDYIHTNDVGRYTQVLMVTVALFTGAKLTVLRLLLLFVALGYSITKPHLPPKTLLAISGLTIFYWAAATADEYFEVMYTLNIPVHIVALAVDFFLLIVTNVTFIVWVYIEFQHQMKSLRSKRQTEKLRLYRVLFFVLIPLVIIACILYIIEIVVVAGNQRDKWWAWWWIFDGFWEVGYFVVIVLVAYLWRPNENNDRYAYSVQLDSEGFAEEMGQVELSDDEEGDPSLETADRMDAITTSTSDEGRSKTKETKLKADEVADAAQIDLDDEEDMDVK